MTRMQTSAASLAIALLLGLAVTAASHASKTQTALFTLYYATEVKPINKGGVQKRVKTSSGQWAKYRLTRADASKANMQGTVYVNTMAGRRAVASILRVGVWAVLPEGWAGKGNRLNPLSAYRVVAADQKIYPYGSRLFLPSAKGYKTPDGKVLDGYFWVADVGPAIKGPLRFDIFVGRDAVFQQLKTLGISKWRGAVEVNKLPATPKGWDPRSLAGITRVLGASGCRAAQEGSTTQKTPRRARVTKLKAPLKDCLIAFQRKQRQIPKVEYGLPHGAITVWFLTEAAIEFARKS